MRTVLALGLLAVVCCGDTTPGSAVGMDAAAAPDGAAADNSIDAGACATTDASAGCYSGRHLVVCAETGEGTRICLNNTVACTGAPSGSCSSACAPDEFGQMCDPNEQSYPTGCHAAPSNVVSSAYIYMCCSCSN